MARFRGKMGAVVVTGQSTIDGVIAKPFLSLDAKLFRGGALNSRNSEWD